MIKLFFICMLISFPSLSEVIVEDGKGSAFEVLMFGAGQARLGSHGSVTSNPSLLAWLPEEQEIISTNLIRSIKFRDEAIKNARFETDVIPLFAATTRGFGNWGHSYGITTDILKVSSSDINQNRSFHTRTENQEIKLHYGLGYKLSELSSIGLSLRVGRSQRQSSVQSFETQGEDTIIFSSDAKLFYWSTGISIGYTRVFDDLNLGCSVNMMTSHFGAKAEGLTTLYYRNAEFDINNISSSKNSDVGSYKGIPSFNCGIQMTTNMGHLYLEKYYVPPYEEKDFEDTNSIGASHILTVGLEKPLNDEYVLFGGGIYSFPQLNSAEEVPSYMGLSFGGSKKNRHSMNYAGIRWARPIEKANNERLELVFGTKFEY